MDIVEINKLTGERRARSARNNLYNLSSITKEDAVINMAYACKKMYGLRLTVKLLHALDIKNFKF